MNDPMIDTRTAIMESQARSRLSHALHRLLHRLRPYVRADAMNPDIEMPKHKMVWVSLPGGGSYDDSPQRVILQAIKEYPELWAHALPEDCCIVPRKALEKHLGKDAAEVLADHGAAIVEEHAVRARYDTETEERRGQ